ncbi:unnamed protein product [Tetraodon nigroviridis]|uniref:(spotted green pufferfish) hypothetical protein n=1 Tax=Tetraodon nigroviridis TaxID=99883 RepID=Q4RT77_TETNG|nr:unnamed protein product [Tetraodon nigroviridis]
MRAQFCTSPEGHCRLQVLETVPDTALLWGLTSIICDGWPGEAGWEG